MVRVKKDSSKIILLVLFLLLLIYTSIYFLVYKPLDLRNSIFGTIPIIDEGKISVGYTLISPYSRLLTDDPNWHGTVYLLDMLGRSVHTWSTNHQALYSVLEPNGKLLSVLEQTKYSQLFPPGGNTGIIQERDWKSRVTWEYKNEALHHDLALLPNGNLAFTLWEKTPPNIADQVQGGVEGTEMKGVIWSENIVEMNRNKKVVWSWHAYEHLDPKIDIIGPLLPRYAWTVANGIKYMEKNPIDNTPGYLVSMRSLSTVIIIRKSDGEIIWRSPKGILSLQHDPTLLPNGNILVFDNGFDRIPAPFTMFGSRAVEINPKTNKIVWSFDAGQSPIDKVKFFAAIVGGAQRLSNGNTLITDGPRGHIFEVTKSGKVVWDIVSPYETKKTGAFPNNFLFKTRRYAKDEINWPGKLSQPLNNFELRLYNFFGHIYPN